MKNLCLPKLTYRVDHHGMRGWHIRPHYSCIWGYPCEEFQEDSRRLKTLPKSRVGEVKSLPLDGYWAMLNTGPLGGEAVSFYVIVFCSITKHKNLVWVITDYNIGG